MKTIMALDLAGRIGWALWNEKMPGPRYGNFVVPMSPWGFADYGYRLIAVRRWFMPFAGLENVTDVVIEAPKLLPTDTKEKVRWLWSVCSEIEADCQEIQASCRETESQTMYKFWVGSGNLERKKSKAYSVRAAAGQGWPTRTDDEADALGHLCYYAYKHEIAVPWRNTPCPSVEWFDAANRAGPI